MEQKGGGALFFSTEVIVYAVHVACTGTLKEAAIAACFKHHFLTGNVWERCKTQIPKYHGEACLWLLEHQRGECT